MKIGAFAARSRATPEQPAGEPPRPPSHNGAVAVLVVFILVGAFFLFTPQGQSIFGQGLDFLTRTSSGPASSLSTGSSAATSTSSTQVTCPVSTSVASLSAPDIHGNQAAIWYPPDYCTLAGYALGLVNHDRATNGTAPVTLSYDLAAQQHVDSMLYYDYFSHNDTQGLKPYMRYTLLGGGSSDFENVAIEFHSRFSSTADVEGAIHDLEGQMMNNDIACCSNLHRLNILGSLHTAVAIGVAYNSTTVYFGEEFENNYIALSFSPNTCSLSGSCEVVLKGVPLDQTVTARTYAVYVAYDPTPSNYTAAQLNAGPHEYGPGLLIGGVIPCSNPFIGCATFQSGFTVYADKWSTSSSSQYDVEFSLHDFISGQGGAPGYGPGVYTIYVVIGQSTEDSITSLSIFVT